EVRLYAEDVSAGFVPSTGTLHRFQVPAAPGIRVDTGFRDGSAVSPHYDAMLAKVIAHGPTRADAARRLARALGRAAIHGMTTNRDLLVAILCEPEFLARGPHTRYLPPHHPPSPAPPPRPRAGRGPRQGGAAPGPGPGARPAAVRLAPRLPRPAARQLHRGRRAPRGYLPDPRGPRRRRG